MIKVNRQLWHFLLVLFCFSSLTAAGVTVSHYESAKFYNEADRDLRTALDYYNGVGVKKDYGMSVVYFRRAAWEGSFWAFRITELLHLKPLCTQTRDSMIFNKIDLEIDRNAGDLKFNYLKVVGPEDIQLFYKDRKRWITVSITVYRAPYGTEGPMLYLDSKGMPEFADNSKQPNTMFRMVPASKSFKDEFYFRVNVIKKMKFKFLNSSGKAYYKLAVPEDDKHSPVCFLGYFRGDGSFKTEEYKGIEWYWEMRLFAVDGYFVKINAEGPVIGKEVFEAASDITRAIHWPKLSRNGGFFNLSRIKTKIR